MNIFLRHLPGKREVYFAAWNNQPALIKVFKHPKRHEIHAMREIDGHQLLAQTSINTPKLLHSGTLENNTQSVVIYERIPQAKTYYQLTLDQQQSALLKICTAVTELHQAGLIQTDPHLDNFIFKDELVYLIDCAGIQRASFAQCRANFALLLAHLPYPHHRLIEQHYASYLELCQQARYKRLKTYAKKVTRTCTKILTFKSWHRFIACDRKMYDADLFNNLDKLIDKAEILKNGNSSTVAKINFKSNSYIIKRYNLKNLKHALSRCYRPSRAWRTWQNAQCLQLLGFATPKPIAMVERRLGPFRRQAYFIYEAVEGSPLTDSHKSKAQHVLHELKDFMISHGDTKSSNFLVADECIWLLDLDAMRIHNNADRFKKAYVRDIKRFERNWS